MVEIETGPVVAERLKKYDSFSEAVVELLTRAVAFGRGLDGAAVPTHALAASLQEQVERL
jgi:hypothetical protein